VQQNAIQCKTRFEVWYTEPALQQQRLCATVLLYQAHQQRDLVLYICAAPAMQTPTALTAAAAIAQDMLTSYIMILQSNVQARKIQRQVLFAVVCINIVVCSAVLTVPVLCMFVERTGVCVTVL
jgi:hypothetical protein